MKENLNKYEQCIKIGYFADGPWSHKAFEQINADKTMQIVFIMVRYDKQDATLIEYAKKYEIPLLLHKNINSSEFLEEVKQYNADLFVSMSFNQIFGKTVREMPPLKTINCHAGKLPYYRGRNILNWVLINDEKEFGITVHYIDQGIDTGDIILQKTYEITDEDSYASLLERAYIGCADLLYQAIRLIQKDQVHAICQKDIDEVGMYCGRRMEGDELLDWNQSSRDIFNFVRSICKPGPQATAFIRGKKICINKVRLIEKACVYKNTVGQVVGKSESGFFVKTKDTIVEVIEYTYDGKIQIGDRLERA